MLEKITELLNKVNPDYLVVYEETEITGDAGTGERNFVYVEEFVDGHFEQLPYTGSKTILMRLYFSKLTGEPQTPQQRFIIREQIGEEVILPFIRKYESSNYFATVADWAFKYTASRYGADEAGVLLQFECKKLVC